MGNAVEWFDYAIYSYLLTSVGLNFFPDASPGARTLLTFSGIAIPFALRPLGGIVLGPLGDKLGRRRVLSFTIIDRLTPYDLWREIVHEKNMALAVLVGALSIGLCIIIAAAVH